mgnify:CR=1 FL=1
MRGAPLAMASLKISLRGSSPRMRGALSARLQMTGQTGIIPAYAGSTFPRLITLYVARDHPRVCGEHCVLNPACGNLVGSSPRMRGAPSSPTRLSAWREDHPRVCGEHAWSPTNVSTPTGSSPRMRGAHFTKCIASVVKSNSYTVVKVQSTVRCYNFSYPQVRAANDRYESRAHGHLRAATCRTS